LGLLLAVALVVGAVPATSFSTATVPRESSLSVTTDENGVLGINVTDRVSKEADSAELVTVENRFGSSLYVTVELVNPSDGTLIGPDGERGDTVEFPLGTTGGGATKTVNVDVNKKNVSPGDDLAIDLSAAGGGVTVSAPGRSTKVKPGGPSTCPENGKGPPWCR
jgi:hypothetical protein